VHFSDRTRYGVVCYEIMVPRTFNMTVATAAIRQPGENAGRDNQTVKEFLESMPQDRREELISFPADLESKVGLGYAK